MSTLLFHTLVLVCKKQYITWWGSTPHIGRESISHSGELFI
jgi:hypothetical protein